MLTSQRDFPKFKLFHGIHWPFQNNDIDPEFSEEKPYLITFCGILMVQLHSMK